MSDIEYANEIFHENISNIFLNFFKEINIYLYKIYVQATRFPKKGKLMPEREGGGTPKMYN